MTPPTLTRLIFAAACLMTACFSDPAEMERRFRPQYDLCAQFLRDGRIEMALEACNKAEEVNPESLDLLATLGIIHKARGDLARAEEYYKHALEINPEHPPTNTNYGSLLSEQKRYSEAIERYKIALADPGSNSFVLNLNYGRACYELGDLVCADEHYDRALREQPGSCFAMLRLGEAREKQKLHDDAAGLYTRCARTCPDTATCLFRLGEVRLTQGETAEAVKSFRRICEEMPGAEENSAACKYLNLYRGAAK